MVTLIPFSDKYRAEIIGRISDFFGFHSSLLTDGHTLTDDDYEEAAKTLHEWQAEDHELYVIEYDRHVTGFLHLWYKGPSVAWIEDIYVDEAYRLKGIATEAISKAEEIVKQKPNFTALCLDVASRNGKALRLYHKLGYDSISLITLRKEFGANKRDKRATFSGMDFNI